MLREEEQKNNEVKSLVKTKEGRKMLKTKSNKEQKQQIENSKRAINNPNAPVTILIINGLNTIEQYRNIKFLKTTLSCWP